MILYLDTSALVKLFIREAGSDVVFDAVERSTAQATHLLAYAEACAVFARLERETARRGWFEQLRGALDRAWRDLDVLLPDETLVRRAGTLAQLFGLRGFDSIHLAAAEAINRPGEMTFVCFDRRLAAAAREAGLSALGAGATEPGPGM